MADTSRTLPRTFWIGTILTFVLLGLAMMLALPLIGQHEQPRLPVIGQVADFTLTNQDGKITTLADLTNHVWVADIIFTRCAGPCPRMTQQMKSLQAALPADSIVKLVTLTTDPDNDTPSILKRYGEHYGADFGRWTFLTGTKAEIASLARDSLKLGSTPVKAEDRTDSANLFIHTTVFVAVDKHAQMRAVFETGGDGVDWTNVVQPQLLRTIHRLEREP
jgi:cytochrome oxidase Cu insertion factor (SCO1/SenC/PrrC family)